MNIKNVYDYIKKKELESKDIQTFYFYKCALERLCLGKECFLRFLENEYSIQYRNMEKFSYLPYLRNIYKGSLYYITELIDMLDTES